MSRSTPPSDVDHPERSDSSAEIRQMYRQLAEDSQWYFSNVDGEVERLSDDDYEIFILSLLSIDEFITEVLASDEPGYRFKPGPDGKPVEVLTPLSRYAQEIVRFARLNCTGYTVSENIQLFFQCWHAMRMDVAIAMYSRPHARRHGTAPYDLFNEFIGLIRQRGQSPEFRRRLSRRKEKSAANQASGKRFIDGLLEFESSSLLVLRVDFSYLHEYAVQISAKDAKQDLAHFLRNRRSKPKLFGTCLSYLWKLEWGPQKGCHFHMLFFYDGNESARDIGIAQGLGEYWKKITEGRGIYWNCNAKKGSYARLGIGQVEYWNADKRRILENDVLRYLTKSDQYLLAKSLENERCFGHGNTSTARKSTAGRPRLYAE